MTETLCLISAKGGSGKTITAINITATLAELGKSVLLVDLDAATNGLTLFYLDAVVVRKAVNRSDVVNGLFDTDVRKDGSLDFAVIKDKVALLPATYRMKPTTSGDPNAVRARLIDLAHTTNKDFDYIILDAQAGSDIYTQIACDVADRVVIVSEFDPMSIEGIERLKILLHNNIQSKMVWTLMNKVLPEFVDGIKDVLIIARYLNPIPWTADVVRSYVKRQTPLNFQTPNAYTVALMEVTASICGGEVASLVQAWLKKKAEEFTRPAQERLAELEKRIAELEALKEISAVRTRSHFYVEILTVTSTFIAIGLAAQKVFPNLAETLGVWIDQKLRFDLPFLAVATAAIMAVSFWIAEIYKRKFLFRNTVDRAHLSLEIEKLREERTLQLALAQKRITEL